MRTLVLLRGAPGSGKTTFIKENGLQGWTINADDIRLLFQSPVTRIDGGKEISQKNDNKVWDFIYTIMEERMKRGEFVIVDATHSRAQWVSKYKEMAERYRYRAYYVEFIPPIETVLERNAGRETLKQVPEQAVRRMYEFVKTQPLPGWVKKINKEELIEMVSETSKAIDLSHYSKIHHIGDLHGCLVPLQEYVDSVGGIKDDEMWIFVGDYVDRGIQNGELIRYLLENFMGKKNVLFLEGNHEKWIRHWSNGELDEIKSKVFKYDTMPFLIKQEFDMGLVREFCRRLGQMAFYTYGNKIVFVNHAGCPALPTILTTTDEYIHGVGRYEDGVEVENTFNRLTGDDFYQIHGHRNVESLPIRNGRCFNLEGKIEFGGDLRVVTLDKNGFEEFYVKNEVFRIDTHSIPNVSENIPVAQKGIIDELLESKDVIKKSLGDNVVSFNFSRDVFYDKKWNDITTKARGLFVNVNTGKIVARAWDKFFNIEEVDATKYTALKRSMEFPVKIYKKENGFLGLVGYNSEADSLFISSKSTNTGEFAELFKKILTEKNIDFSAMKSVCKDTNVTLVFEVVDPINDPHIIDYDDCDVYLLNVVCNDFEYKAAPYSIIEGTAKMIGSKWKEEVAVFDNWQGFSDWYSQIEGSYEYCLDGSPIEGFVVECADGFMFKIKTEYYQTWKRMRGVLDKLVKGRVYNTSWLRNPLEIQVYQFMKDNGRAWLEGKSIIDVRKEFLSRIK